MKQIFYIIKTKIYRSQKNFDAVIVLINTGEQNLPTDSKCEDASKAFLLNIILDKFALWKSFFVFFSPSITRQDRSSLTTHNSHLHNLLLKESTKFLKHPKDNAQIVKTRYLLILAQEKFSMKIEQTREQCPKRKINLKFTFTYISIL